MSVLGLACTQCQAEYPNGPMFDGCPDCSKKGNVGALSVAYDYDAIARSLDIESWSSHNHSIWRFQDVLPVKDPALQICPLS